MKQLKERTRSSVRWTSLNTICITVIQFVQLAVLGRILNPEDYGLMAMVMVVIGFAQIFQDIGLSSAIIQRKDPKKQELSTLYWINIVTGFILCGITYLSAPFVAGIFKTNEITAILRVSSFAFLIAPFGAQFQTLLRKELCFDKIVSISIISALFGLLVAISFALHGYGVWSLVFGSLSIVSLRTVLLILNGIKRKQMPMMHFNWADTNGYISFGLFRVGGDTANYFIRHADQLMIGALLGPTALGYYYIAFRLVVQPISRINPILTRVAFPVFSIIQDDKKHLKNGFIKMSRILASINAPLLIGLAAVADLAVPFIVGDKWNPSVPLVQILAFYALLRSLGNASGGLVLAKGKANWYFYSNMILLVCVPIIIYLASFGGNIIHIAFALVGLQCVLLLFYYRYLVRNILGPCFLEYISSMLFPVSLAFVMGGIVLISSFFLPPFSPAINLFIMVGIGGVVYMTLSWFFQRNQIIEFVELLPVGLKIRELIKKSI